MENGETPAVEGWGPTGEASAQRRRKLESRRSSGDGGLGISGPTQNPAGCGSAEAERGGVERARWGQGGGCQGASGCTRAYPLEKADPVAGAPPRGTQTLPPPWTVPGKAGSTPPRPGDLTQQHQGPHSQASLRSQKRAGVRLRPAQEASRPAEQQPQSPLCGPPAGKQEHGNRNNRGGTAEMRKHLFWK